MDIEQYLNRREYENIRSLYFDFKRWRTRTFQKTRIVTSKTQLQLGSGGRPIEGWLNVDLQGSDVNVDLGAGKLPFDDMSFHTIVSQHVVEHLFLEEELLPLLQECYRCLQPGGKLWLSTPDMKKIVHSYLKLQCKDLIADRESRIATWKFGNYPSQHMMNDLFQQCGEHKNLFDVELITWVLLKAGFSTVDEVQEPDLLTAHPECNPRLDDLQSLYVLATR